MNPILVAERLPETHETAPGLPGSTQESDVLLAYGSKNFLTDDPSDPRWYFARYQRIAADEPFAWITDNDHCLFDEGDVPLKNVTHWMPMPSAPHDM